MRATAMEDSQLRRQTPQCLHNPADRVRRPAGVFSMNRSMLAAVVLALMLGSCIAGYVIGSPADSVHKTPPARVATTSPIPAPAPPPPTPPAIQPTAAPSEAFVYRRFTVDSSRPEAEACFAFNKP